MNKVTMSGGDGFWARVRALLGRGTDEPDFTLGDTEISQRGRKSRPQQQIEDELHHGWNEAAARRVSLCVLAMDMDGYADYFAAYGRESVEQTLSRLSQAIEAVLPREEQGRPGSWLSLKTCPASWRVNWRRALRSPYGAKACRIGKAIPDT